MMNCSRSLVGLMALAGIAGAAVTTVTPGTATVDVPGLNIGHVTGTVLPIWNPATTYEGLKRGLMEQEYKLFRFPNGSASNNYHWNGAGAYDSVGIWHVDSAKVLPGFMSDTRYRGTTKSNYGAIFHSRITDGADSTFWWSDPLGGNQPWVMLDFGADSAVDSVRIAWGDLRPDSVLVGFIAKSDWSGYRSIDGVLESLAKVVVTENVTEVAFAAKSARFLVIKPVGVKSEGVQIAEVSAWSKGAKATKNTPSQATQTPVRAMGAHPGSNRGTGWANGTPPWTFAMFMDYIKAFPKAEGMMCVNYGTGTPEEAAAWVKYANIDQKLGIKYWQVGNEMDGNWEEGGPVDARQYAVKFLAYARAMRAVDPSIVILGPVQAGMTFSTSASGHLDGTSWTEEVLRIVGEAETKDGVRYMDGFDFHAYPYWTDTKSVVRDALKAMQGLKENLDTLSEMMKRHLKDPGSRLICMSEFNMSVVSMDLLMRPENALGNAIMLSQLIEKFGGNAMTIEWESFDAGAVGPASTGATFGALSLFSDPKSGSASSDRYVPNSPYWGNWMVSKLWAIDGAKPLPTTVNGSMSLEAHALVNGTDTSYLLLNIASTPCSTQVSNVSSGWVYTFSGKNYAWNRSDDQAFAFPNAGPSAMPVAAAWKRVVEVPAFGMAVVRKTPAIKVVPTGAGHVVNFSVKNKQLQSGDTVQISGTFVRAPDAAAPIAIMGDTAVALIAIDGVWDGDIEGFTAKLSTELLGEGVWWIKVGETDSVNIEITGKIRPTVWVDRFNDMAFASEQPSNAKWTNWHADEAEDSAVWEMSFVAREGYSNALLTSANLVQPTSINYTVVGFTGVSLDSLLVSNSIGLQFDYLAKHANAGSFALGVPTDTVKDYQDYSINLTRADSTWVTKRVLWSDFTQPSWAVQCGPLRPYQINQLSFRIQGPGKAVMMLDNVVLLGTSGDSAVRLAPSNRMANWSVVRGKGAWQILIPAGAKVSVVGLDGRRLATFSPEASVRTVAYQTNGSGVVYAVLESMGRRDQKMLPNIR